MAQMKSRSFVPTMNCPLQQQVAFASFTVKSFMSPTDTNTTACEMVQKPWETAKASSQRNSSTLLGNGFICCLSQSEMTRSIRIVLNILCKWGNFVLRKYVLTSALYLKGNSTDYTHQSLFIDLGESHCVCEKSWEALQGAVRNLINVFERRHLSLHRLGLATLYILLLQIQYMRLILSSHSEKESKSTYFPDTELFC